VIDYETLRGAQNEETVKEVSVAGENVIETFHFKPPYPMTAHGSEENGLAWADGLLKYDKLRQTMREAVSGYAHLYAYGLAKTRFLAELVAQSVRNLEEFVSSAPRPQGAIRLQYAVPQELSKPPLRNSKRAYTIQMARASP
jgi:hypothetical protein